MLRHRANVLKGLLDFMSNNFPNNLYRYRRIIDDLQNTSTRSCNSLLQTAVDNNIDVYDIYLDLQNPLDLLAGNIESTLCTLVTRYTSESDTDIEKNTEAAQEDGLSFTWSDSSSDSNSGRWY